MVPWRSAYACGDVNVNKYESLDSEFEDESLSSEQLKISPVSDLWECRSASTAESNSSSSRKAGRKAVWRENVMVWYSRHNLFSEYLRTNLSSETLSVPETCVSWRRLGMTQQLLSTTFESTVARQSRWSRTLYNWVRRDDSATFKSGLNHSTHYYHCTNIFFDLRTMNSVSRSFCFYFTDLKKSWG